MCQQKLLSAKTNAKPCTWSNSVVHPNKLGIDEMGRHCPKKVLLVLVVKCALAEVKTDHRLDQ